MAAETSRPSATGKGLRRTGLAGIALGLLTLLLCELPVILAVVGLGGFSAAAARFHLPPAVEMAGFAVGTIGAVVMAGYVVRRVWLKRKGARA